jgi:catechol 2,3-dioxygenase-like lactoylglutathione lyase family enzyme
MTDPITAELKMTTVDCADPRAEAAFWSALLGWEVVHAEDDYAMLASRAAGPTPALGFGRVPGYQPPSWPDDAGGKQFHLDLACDDVATLEARAIELGAALADPQPGDTWRVLLDPAGHPFCLTAADRW